MTTYTLLIYRNKPLSEPDPPQEARTAMAGHRSLQAKARAERELLAVAQLGETKHARVVKRAGVAHEVTDGPYIETKEWLVGFYLLDCETEAEAIERAQMICTDDTHTIEVRPVTWHWKGKR